jgi:hypothetical protein
VLGEQHAFAQRMGVASDVNIRRVVESVLEHQQCLVGHMVVASDVKIRRVVLRRSVGVVCVCVCVPGLVSRLVDAIGVVSHVTCHTGCLQCYDTKVVRHVSC